MVYKSFIIMFYVVISITFLGCGGGGSNSSLNTKKPEAGLFQDNKLDELTRYFQKKYDVPALCALTINIEGEVESSSIGKRQYSLNEDVSSLDHWAFGSITKSMTATLTAAMVEAGLLDWNTTLVEVFPEFEEIQEKYKNITVVELLSHSAGFPQDNDGLWEDYIDNSITLISQRYEFTQDALEYENNEKQGEFLYSNVNYIIVSSMLEKLSGESYENLMEEYLFTPLGMNNTYFETSNQYNDIWGHKKNNGEWKSIDPTEEGVENAALLAPAGSRIFITLEDISKYLLIHLKAKNGEFEFLKEENYKKLHSKVLDTNEGLGYSLGWFTEGDYGLQHTGSNNRWFSLAFINSDTKTAHFISTNSATKKSQEAVFKMMQELIKRIK